MAETEAMALENLQEWIFDNNKIVTFKFLSLTLSLHVNLSKQILEKFVKQFKNKPGFQVSVVYCVSGFVEEGDFKLYKVELVSEESLAKVESSYIPPVSRHIYSVQQSPIKNPSNLYIADYDLIKQHIFSTNHLSAIQCPSARLRVQPEPAEVQPATEIVTSIPQAKKEEKTKTGASTKGVSSFFGKQNQKPAVINKPTEVPKKEPESFLLKPNCVSLSTKETKSAAVVSNGTIESKKSAQNENGTHQRKRRRVVVDSSSEDEEEEAMECGTNEIINMEVGEAESVTQDPKVEEPVSVLTDTTQQRMQKKLVSKTYVNDEGFMVTEKVWETCEVNESPVAEPKAAPEKPAQKPAVAIQQPLKKKSAPPKGNKQTSLMKFFTKQ